MTRFSEQDLATLLKGRNNAPTAVSGRSRHLALGRLPAGTMNRTEALYAEHLGNLMHIGEVLWYKFEGIKLRLADKTFLTVDFAVLPKSCIMELREVKGFMEDDAAVKLKVAASIYPFRFVLVRARPKKAGGGWIETEI